MARARQKPSGKWEIGLRHPSLPGGRKYFTFDTEEEANAYAQQWTLMKMSGIAPPAELLQRSDVSVSLTRVILAWANCGDAAPSQQSPLRSLTREVGNIRLQDATYAWLRKYIEWLKVDKNLAPGSIRQRVQALGRSIDEWCRNHPDVAVQNPTRLLLRGYSTYSERDAALATAAGKKAKTDVARDRRLHPGEQERIEFVLSGGQLPDTPRGLQLRGGNAMLTLFRLIVGTGLRLREAYTLTRGQVDMDAKVIHARSSKQWRGRVAFRDVPIRQEVHAALREYLSTRALLPTARLFPFMDEDDGFDLPQTSRRLSARFRLAFRYARIPDLREHDLRHEATCRWFELRDVSGQWLLRPEEINRIMGWATGSAMASRYASFRSADLAARLWETTDAARSAR